MMAWTYLDEDNERDDSIRNRYTTMPEDFSVSKGID
jgi:hypothetical protein